MALSKSLMELDKLADEILAKSIHKSDDDDDLQPSDISDDDSVAVDDSDTTDEDTDDTDEEETKKSTRKSMRKSTRKSMRKSDDTDDDYDEDDDEDEDDSQYAKCIDDDDNDVTKSDASISDTSSIDDTDPEGEDDELSHAKVAKSTRKSMRKSDDDDDDSDDDDYDDDEDDTDVADDFSDDPDVSKAVKSSRFYAALTDIIAKSLSDLQLDVRSQGRDSNNSSAILAKSLQASIAMNAQMRATNDRLARRVSKLEKSMRRDTERIMDALDEIAAQPAGMRKSVRSLNIHDRNFAKSLGDSQPEGFESLSKSQVMSILENELYSGNQAVTAQDIIGYESGAPLSDSLKSLVVSKA